MSLKTNSTANIFFRVGSFSACSLLSIFALSSPARAQCFGVNGLNTCPVFNPENTSSVVDTGGFSGGAFGSTFVKARILFATNGNWLPSFTLTGISLKGDGIPATLAFPDFVVSPSSSWTANATPYINLPTSVTSQSYANNKLSFVIPAGAANTIGNYASISARIMYATSEDFGVPSSPESKVTSVAVNYVPSPLPLMGAASAFAFSRKLRHRRRQAKFQF